MAPAPRRMRESMDWMMRMFILVPAFEIGNHVLRPVRLCNENDAVTGGKAEWPSGM